VNTATTNTTAAIIYKPKTPAERSAARAERAASREQAQQGMLEAQRLAREQHRKLTQAKRTLHRQGLSQVPDIIIDSVGNNEVTTGNDEEYSTSEINDSSSSNRHTQYNDDTELNEDSEPLRILQVGPYRWTPNITNEYINKFKSLEGKLYAHPRTQRIYEITTVFFHPVKKIAAAYSRIVDGGQPDVHDLYPSRIEGKLGLEELVQKFEESGGSTGSSKTKWPDNADGWAKEMNRDTYWGPKLKPLLTQLYELRAQEIHKGKSHETVLKETYLNPTFLEFDKVKFKYNGLLYMQSDAEGKNEESGKRHRLVVPQSLQKMY